MLLVLGLLALPISAQDGPGAQGKLQRKVVPPTSEELGLQPFALHVRRVAQALADLGAPLTKEELATIDAAVAAPESPGDRARVDALDALLAPRTLVVLALNPEGRATPSPGPAAASLDQHDARSYLVRVENGCGSTAPLAITSPQAFEDEQAPGKWLELRQFVGAFVRRELSGLPREYRIVSLGARDAGRRAATLRFDLAQGEQFATSPAELDVLFDVRPAVEVRLELVEGGAPAGPAAMAAFTVRDARGWIHPAQALRHGADFRFQPQVYRASGESLWLQPGEYRVACERGPEYLADERALVVPALAPGSTDGAAPRVEWKLAPKRWIDPAASSWWSGDHHVHASGCAHYATPGVGVGPEEVLRHTRGEDLKVALCLTWGVGWDYQQQFFTGRQDARSSLPYLLRYDVEVSGFGSHRSGHLCLLGLKQQEYLGVPGINHWPVLGLATLRWAKAQGAVCGTAHSGLGLALDSTELPNDRVPPFDGVGANEFVVDVTHEVPGPGGSAGAMVPAVDFYGVGDTPWPWELNLWYRVLDVGFAPKLAGETDFPCLGDQHVGAGRSYVKLAAGAPSVDGWIAGLAAGRSYVGDGRSHLMDFAVDGVAVGGAAVSIAKPGRVRVTTRAAAWLATEPDASIASRSWKETPYWHVERARVPGTRSVAVECVVNGVAVAKELLVADGTQRELAFDVPIERSSWIALRILPSCHTNPITVSVAGAPVRASRKSAEYLLQCVERCWSQKARFYEGPEAQHEAEAAYEHARAVYRKRAEECGEGR